MSDANILAAITTLGTDIASLRTDIDDRLTAIDDRLTAFDGRLTALTARVDHMQGDIMVRINSQFDRILDTPTANRQDGDTTKGHLIFALQENLTLSQRITKLEEEARKPR